jgi:hypothetical protein
MRITLIAAALIAFSLAIAPAFAQSEEEVVNQIESIHGDSVGFGEAFGMLQDGFLFGDLAVTMANMAFYPLPIEANGEAYDIIEPQDLIDNFSDLVTLDTQDALASQDFADLIVTSEGVGFANGALWMTNVCLDDGCAETQWGILSINN